MDISYDLDDARFVAETEMLLAFDDGVFDGEMDIVSTLSFKSQFYFIVVLLPCAFLTPHKCVAALLYP
jgi:hypothetical protein